MSQALTCRTTSQTHATNAPTTRQRGISEQSHILGSIGVIRALLSEAAVGAACEKTILFQCEQGTKIPKSTRTDDTVRGILHDEEISPHKFCFFFFPVSKCGPHCVFSPGNSKEK